MDPVVVRDRTWGFVSNKVGVIFKLCEMGVEEGTKGSAHVHAILAGDGWMGENILNEAGENVFNDFEGVKVWFMDAVRGRFSLAIVGHGFLSSLLSLSFLCAMSFIWQSFVTSFLRLENSYRLSLITMPSIYRSTWKFKTDIIIISINKERDV